MAKNAKQEARESLANRSGALLNTPTQILTALKGVKGHLTRREIADKVAKNAKLVNGRVANETNTYGALDKAGYIKVSEVNGETVHTATADGKAALEKSGKIAKEKAKEKAKAKAKK